MSYNMYKKGGIVQEGEMSGGYVQGHVRIPLPGIWCVDLVSLAFGPFNYVRSRYVVRRLYNVLTK